MNAEASANKHAIAENFTKSMQGKLEQHQIDAVTTSLMATSASYPAKGSVASLIFYLKFQVKVSASGGKEFNGNAGGASTPGGGALFGDIYTDDLDALYSKTKSFEFQSTPVYLSILFFDGSSNLLGHFQCGAVSTVVGVGGGSGSWS